MTLLDTETAQQIEEQNLLKAAHKRRLFVLQEKAAQFGFNTPAEIKTEIGDIEHQITVIDATITKLYIAAARQAERNLIGETLFGNDPNTSIESRLAALGRYIMQVEDSLRNEVAGVYRTFDIWRSSDSGERVNRQRRLDYFLYIIVTLLIALIAISLLR
jgi:hypothetical protein